MAIATGLTQLMGSSASSAEQMTHALMERLTALGRAHDVVRPLPGEQGIKYGALSCAEGALDVSCRTDGGYLDLI